MRQCAAKAQILSKCRIRHSSQSAYCDAVALLGAFCGATARRLFLARVLDDTDNPPKLPVSRTDAGGFGFSALCMTTGLSRDGDRLDRLSYCVGSGLSWKPSAAAFRFRAFNILAFTLASYSSIDCVTYFWPYLSIQTICMLE